MAWEENPRICLHMQLIAILSRTGVYVTSNRLASKSIYFVVYDSRGLQLVKNNMNEYGISFDELQLSQNEINIVYTSKGPEDCAFKQMLEIV